MNWLVSIAGVGLVLVVVRDIFHTLWHPSGQGTLTRFVTIGVWRTFRATGSTRLLGLAGPFGLVLVIALWALVAVVGWALVYYPHLPDAFRFAQGLSPDERSAAVDALYLSGVTVTTLGYGDITPTVAWLRAVAPLQALVGFAVLTAAVTWVLQVYPALARRRALALRLASLQDAGAHEAVRTLDSTSAAALLDSLAAELLHVRVGLTQYAETFYYREEDPRASLPSMARYCKDLALAGAENERPDVQFAAATLSSALEDLATVLRANFRCEGADVTEVFTSLAREHRQAG